MFVPFNSLHPASRLWIFQAEQKFSDAQLTIINTNLQLFTTAWAAHGQPLQASFEVRENLFVILGVNDQFQAPSGCSIDDSVQAIREIGKLLGQDLFRRDLVWFKMGDKLQVLKVAELKTAFNAGIWNENTLTFNTLVVNKGQLDAEWLVPANSTWLKRYIAKEQVTH